MHRTHELWLAQPKAIRDYYFRINPDRESTGSLPKSSGFIPLSAPVISLNFSNNRKTREHFDGTYEGQYHVVNTEHIAVCLSVCVTGTNKGKYKGNVDLYRSHSFTCKLHRACLYLVSVHQMALPLHDLWQRPAIAAYWSSVDPERMKRWVGLAWLADLYSGRYTQT